MIRKMTKYSFLILSGETDAFLDGLQETGLIDISRSAKPVDRQTAELYGRAGEISKLIERIEKDDYTRCEEYNVLCDSLAKAQARYAESLPWGGFDRELIKKLGDAGCKIRFFSVPEKKFNPQWEQDYPLAVINRLSGNVYFVMAAADGAVFPAAECKVPELDPSSAEAEIKALEASIKEKERQLSKEKENIPALAREKAECLDELQKQLARRAKCPAAEDTVDTFVGFAPSDDNDRVKQALDKMGVFYIAEPARKEDNPPVQLKNNWFARNFETLTGMYGMPVYDEFDPTPILAPFFLLFWAFCMGDAGYGLVLIGVGILLRKYDIMGLKNHWRLVTTLGVGAAVIGLFLATFFGINLTEVSWIPEGCKKLMLSGKLDVGGSSYDITMVAALVIGVVHICLAMVIKAVGLTKRFGFKEAISTWGWVILIIGGILVAAGALTSVLNAQATKIAVIVIGVLSALGIFIFNKPGRNPLVNIGAGLWDTYGMATGIVGDVLSYIRLYALGLAGGMLGAAFNDLGAMVLGTNPTWQWIFFAVIVLIGHALNFAMSCLGAFVHPLRLTFVEYFKNSGYEGKGTEFNPLKKETYSQKQ